MVGRTTVQTRERQVRPKLRPGRRTSKSDNGGKMRCSDTCKEGRELTNWSVQRLRRRVSDFRAGEREVKRETPLENIGRRKSKECESVTLKNPSKQNTGHLFMYLFIYLFIIFVSECTCCWTYFFEEEFGRALHTESKARGTTASSASYWEASDRTRGREEATEGENVAREGGRNASNSCSVRLRAVSFCN